MRAQPDTVPRIRVGFVINTVSAGWLGGLNYFRSLLSAIAEHGSGEVEPVVIVGDSFPSRALATLLPVEIGRTRGLDRFHPAWVARGASMVVLRHDWPMERTLRRQRIDVISHSVPPGPRGGIPSIAWIPDFQHVHLPELFRDRERRFRDRHFRALAENATIVLLSSESAAEDLRRFAPDAASKARVLRFAVDPPPADLVPPEDDVRERYGLDGPFLLVANQFWAHKNHRVVVEALAALRARGVQATVAATGDTHDYRSPEVFHQLMARAREVGVEESFRVLGQVPYSDVAGLMRASAALVNPSLFEGWNTGVEEAKSAGKRTIVSDIPVHREQDPPGAVYFNPHDPDALADAVERVFAESGSDADAALERAAAAELPGRRSRFALRYEEIVREALAAG